MTDPLWLRIRNHPRLFCLHPTQEQIAIMLRFISDEIEDRGMKNLDRDPGETADWLRAEADQAAPVGDA